MLSKHAASAKDKRTAESTPMFQHRHFAYIAEILRTLPMDEHSRKSLAKVFAGELQVTNPNFDWDRFMKAAGVNDEQS